MRRPSHQPTRWLHLWFDHLSTDRLLRGRPPLSAPFGLIARQGSAIRLMAVDASAQALGLSPGLTLAAARARVPDLQVEDADLAADAAFLKALAETCRRYTPAIALHAPNALDLEIGRSAHLFGGEAALIEMLQRRFTDLGLSLHIGAASNPAAAFAFARFGTPEEPGSEVKKIARLPVDALDLPPGELTVLIGLGLRRIGMLAKLPRASLGLRLELSTLERLDQVFGRRTLSLPLIEEVSPFMAEARLAEPICDEDQVMGLCLALARRLVEAMQAKGRGGRRFVFELFRVDGAIKRLEVRASHALTEPSRIAALFAERLAALNEGLDVDFGFDAARLWAGQTRRLRHETAQLIGQANRSDQLIAVLDRAGARFGPNVACRFAPNPRSRLPEASVEICSLAESRGSAWATQDQVFENAMLRPTTLFASPQPIFAVAGVPEDPPKRFTWRRVERLITRAEGPERIAVEWWRKEEAEFEAEPQAVIQASGPKPDPVSELDSQCFPAKASDEVVLPHNVVVMTPVRTAPKAEAPAADEIFLISLPNISTPARDYYRLEDTEGRRYWVFREGLYGADEAPRWFLHGLFA